MSLLLVCLLDFFPFLYHFFTQLKNKELFPPSPQERHRSISRYAIATKLNMIVDSINSLVNVGLFQDTPTIWHIAAMKQEFIGTHFAATAAFFYGANAPLVCNSATM